MAIIGKIREKSTFLLIVVGGALIAFVLTDLFSTRSSVFGEDYNTIGSIDGHDIKGIEFNELYEKEIENYKVREKTDDVPEFIQNQMRDQVWEKYLNDILLGSQLDELGITVSTEELADMAYGDNPHPQVKQAFTNPKTGQFNKNDVINFLKNLENDETGKTKNQWLVFETAMKRERRANKYYELIKKGLYTTQKEAGDYYAAQNKRISLSYVAKRYADVADSTVEVDKSDIKDYYKKNQNKFIEKKSRKIEYAVFRVNPSGEDSAAVREWVSNTYNDLIKTEDDSMFVNSHSDREFDFRFYSKNDEDLNFDTSLFLRDTAGYVVEPFIEFDKYKMMKITRIKYAPDSVKARHILLTARKREKEESKRRIDSMKTEIEIGADFAELAKRFSVDPGSKENGGDLGWFKEGFMIPIINDSCFKAELNKLLVVESPFGIHLIQVTEQSPVVKKLQVAIIERSIDASRKTVDLKFTASNELSLEFESGGELVDLANKYGADYNTIDIRENDFMIPDVESSRGLIRWAYGAEVGQTSEAMQFGGNFVVVKLLEIHDDGVAPLERVKKDAEQGAIKEKKAEIFLKEMSGFSDLQDASNKLGLKTETAENVTFESFSVPGIGREPELVGKIFTMNTNDLSVPIKGELGVYIVHIDRVSESPEANDLGASINQLNSLRTSRVNFEVFEALKKRVDIEDNRLKFY